MKTYPRTTLRFKTQTCPCQTCQATRSSGVPAASQASRAVKSDGSRHSIDNLETVVDRSSLKVATAGSEEPEAVASRSGVARGSFSAHSDNSNSNQILVPLQTPIWGFPKISGTLLGVPIIRTIVYWGLYWGSPYLGKVPYILM